MENKHEFVEKQYIGRDYIRICIRLVMASFCFAAYVYERDRNNTLDLLLVVGFGIIGISIILLFLVQYKTVIKNQTIIIDGLWTSKRVEIDLKKVVEYNKTTYNSFFLNNPVYNLHRKGSVRFFSSGKDVITLTTRDGLTYHIGTQRPNEMYLAIKEQIEK